MADAFTTQLLPPGVAGVDLKRPVDIIAPARLSRWSNLVRNEEGALTSRPGQTTVGTAGSGAAIHSIIRVNSSSGYGRVLGVGTELYCGDTGAFDLVETGFSGNPLSFVTAHPPISGESWVYIGDSTKMRKVNPLDCTDLPVGLPPPPASDTRIWIDEFRIPVPASLGTVPRMQYVTIGFTIVEAAGGGVEGDLTTYAAQNTTTIDNCDAAGWTNNAGSGGAPTNAVDAVDFKEGAGSTKFSTQNGAAAGAYYNFWNKAAALDLSSINGVGATDDDIIHLWIKTDRPDVLLEARLYFVVNSSFSTSAVPGTDASNNTEAYFKAFRPSDFTPIYEVSSGTIAASATANTNLSTLDQLPKTDDTRSSTEAVRQQTERRRRASNEVGPGRGAWSEFGIIGIPLHRRDFARIGTDSSRTWANVTGLVFVAQMSTNADINVWLDDIYLTGGAGPDTSLVGMQPYDYRYINYDPRTGTKSNPNPVQGPGFRLDAKRRGIVVHPQAYGDSNIRQRFYRRGGVLNNNWYYLGENTEDGGDFTDTLSDLAILAAGTVEIDNDQPVTTVDNAGNAVLGQPLPALWGPVSDIMFGCGDPHRKGDVYWSKPLQYDAWPTINHVEACPPSEELMCGVVHAGQGFAFSRERMFSVVPNVASASIVSTQPTSCASGVVSRKAATVCYGAIYGVARTKVFRTTGGAEEDISDDALGPLFIGETKNGRLPIDFSQPNAIALECHDDELWFLYRDTGGTNQVAIYDPVHQFWRFADFGREIAGFCSEEGVAESSLLLGGRTTGKLYEYDGFSDDGLAITASGRTGAWDQGLPREDKLYGDIVVDVDRQSETVSVTPRTNNDTTTLAALTITSGAGRDRYYLDTKNGGTEPVQGRNISFEFSWSSSTGRPVLFKIGPSFTPQPDTSTLRVTNWDPQGRLSDKYVKGIVIDADTNGVAKSINIQADGVTAATISVNHNGRRSQMYSFPQFLGRLLRFSPADSNPWKLYAHQWIFDEEPLALDRWETQEINHGIPTFQYPLFCYLTYKATAEVTCTVTAYDQDGDSTTEVYTFAATGGVKRQAFWQFRAQQGVLWKWVFTSSARFWLYKSESPLTVKPWVGDAQVVQPFGDDNLDGVRGLRDAGLGASRSGGGGV